MDLQSFSDSFAFDLDRAVELINKSIASTVGLQFPEGFKRQALSVALELESRTHAAIVISGNPCYGACDIDMDLADAVDLLFHFGHSELLDGLHNVIFMETPAKADIIPVVEKAIRELEGSTVGLITTVQHVRQLEKAGNLLNSRGITCVVGKGDSRIKYPGQVLGCNFSAAHVDCDNYLFIGSGRFHPLGVAIATGRKVLAADPFSSTVEWVDPERMKRIRHGVIARCREAGTFGIIMSTKIGQKRSKLASRMGELARRCSRKYINISMDNITPEALLQFKVDAFVNTACPRIAIDDMGRFNAPVLTPVEFEILLGQRNWDEFVLDEIREGSN